MMMLNKYHKKNIKEQSDVKPVSFRLVMSSVVLIFLCVGLLFSGTWAWFAVSLSMGGNQIKTAAFEVLAVVTQLDENDSAVQIISPDEQGVYTLEAHKSYELSLKRTGTAVTGYAKLTLGTNTYYYQFTTEQADPYLFKLPVQTSAANLRLSYRWGTYSKQEASGGLLAVPSSWMK